MQERLRQIAEQAREALGGARDLDELERARATYLCLLYTSRCV